MANNPGGGPSNFLINNPEEIASVHPLNWYHNGLLENYVNPVHELTSRPEGALGLGPSDQAITYVPDENPDPFPTPGMNLQGGVTPITVHNAGALDTSEPRSMAGHQATETWYQSHVGNGGILDQIQAYFAGSPVAALFLGLAGLLAFNHFVLRSRGVGRGGRAVGAGVAGVGGAAASGITSTAEAGQSAIQSSVSGAVDAVEGIGSGN